MSLDGQTFRRDVVAKEYGSRRHLYESLEREALFVLEKAITSTNTKIDQIEHRIKSLESVLAKCEARRSESPDLSDIVGLRVVALFRSDLPRIDSAIRKSFDVQGYEDKTGQSVDAFGYMSIHYDCRMKASYVGPRYEGLADLFFEIQVRTLCMHAWATVSHYLDYKNEKDIPFELRKELNALSGLFYVADSQFESAYRSRIGSKNAAIEQATTSEILSQPLNLDTLGAYLQQRFEDRNQPDPQDTSDLLSEILAAGVTTVGSLAEFLDAAMPFALEHEEKNPPVPDFGEQEDDEVDDGRFAAIGIVRVAMQIASNKFYVGGEFRNDKLEKYQDRLPEAFKRKHPLAQA